jgi:hypothetical protein
MQRMLSNWPTNNPELARTRSAEYLEEYRRVGALRFEHGVTRALRGHATGFHPTLGEFLNYVPEAEDQTLDQKIERWKADYEAAQSDPEYQRELALLKAKLKQLTGK